MPHQSFNSIPRRRRALGILVLGLAVSCAALAQPAQQESEAEPAVLRATQQWLDAAVANLRPSATIPLRMAVEVGQLSSRLKLAPCTKVEPYIPAGSQLWGKTRLGVRCLEGPSRWTVFLPVTIKAFGTAWVLKSNVLPGAVLTEDDAMEAEVDWAAERSPILGNPAHWVGQVASRSLTAGQALRQGMTRAAQVFQAGAQVRVVAQGAGFQISTAGQALSAGYVGQSARVKMDNGKVMSGIVLDEQTIRIAI
jgi:flagella basal body P-ring formation protein FlgA